jgi:D-arabinose 1-dehydrogenase-like Zn-dependent alcohol dehydrogenase
VRAARFVGPGRPIRIDDVPDPIPGSLDVVVKVEACGICASDLHLIHGELPLPAPMPLTMGHEASGTIGAIGSHVPSGWRIGDRVSLLGGKACMSCPRCATGQLEECLNPQIMGAHYDGAWAESVVVPFSALAALPDAVSFEHGAIACDAVATPYAALADRGALRPGERVGIWGIGGLGTHGVQIARMMGAAFIAAIDPLPTARDRALALGADLALDPADDVPDQIRAATGDRRLDLAIDFVGRASVTKQAMFCMARGGRIVVVGISLETLQTGPMVVLAVQGIGVLGHLGYGKRHLEQVLDLVARGRLDLSTSISGRLPLDRVNEGIERLTSKADSPVRLLVLPQT